MIAMPAAIDVPLRLDSDHVLRIGSTRVTLQAVIADFHRGASPEEIAHHYSAVQLAEIYLVLGYYLQNRAEVDAYLREQNELAAEARRAYQIEYSNDPLRERLLTRFDQQSKQK